MSYTLAGNGVLTDIPWVDLKSSQLDFLVLATGSVEQHGPHLPLGADYLVAERIAQEVVRRFSVLQLPFTPVGVNFMFQNWAGTLNISAGTYTKLIVEIGANAAKICPRLLIINGHDENQPLLLTAAQQLVTDYGMEVVVFEWAELVLDILRSVCESKYEMHAGEGLTSLFLHWFPQHVRMERIEEGTQISGGLASNDIHLDHRAYNPRLINPSPEASGVFGNPSLANAEKGAKIAEALIERVTELVRELNWEGAAAR